MMEQIELTHRLAVDTVTNFANARAIPGVVLGALCFAVPVDDRDERGKVSPTHGLDESTRCLDIGALGESFSALVIEPGNVLNLSYGRNVAGGCDSTGYRRLSHTSTQDWEDSTLNSST